MPEPKVGVKGYGGIPMKLMMFAELGSTGEAEDIGVPLSCLCQMGQIRSSW